MAPATCCCICKNPVHILFRQDRPYCLISYIKTTVTLYFVRLGSFSTALSNNHDKFMGDGIDPFSFLIATPKSGYSNTL